MPLTYIVNRTKAQKKAFEQLLNSRPVAVQEKAQAEPMASEGSNTSGKRGRPKKVAMEPVI